MKKSRVAKLLVTVLAVVLVFAFATTAFAYSSYSTISASSSSSQIKKSNISRSYDSWYASDSDSYFTGFSDTVRLTVRPYEHNTSTKLSVAKTYSPTVQSGGHDYDIYVNSVDVKANSTESGVLCGVTGTWKF